MTVARAVGLAAGRDQHLVGALAERAERDVGAVRASGCVVSVGGGVGPGGDHAPHAGGILLDEDGLAAGARVGEEVEHFQAEQGRVRGQEGDGGRGFDDASRSARSAWCRRRSGADATEAGAALDVGAGGALPDGVEDAHRAREVGAGGVGVVDGEAAGDAGGLGDQFQRRVGILAHGPGEQGGAVERPPAGAEGLGGGELHPLEEVAVGHALDARQRLLRQGGGFRRRGSAAGAT